MYTNVSNVVKSCIQLLERNADIINKVINEYEPGKKINIFAGMRKSLPRDAYPAIEIEPTSASNEWAACRTQRPRYSFECTLTILNDNEDFGVEYISTVVRVLVQIMTDPRNLQMNIIDEFKWSPNDGQIQSWIMDSLVDNVTYNSSKDGTIRIATWDWFALINESYPEWMFSKHSGSLEAVPVKTIIKPA